MLYLFISTPNRNVYNMKINPTTGLLNNVPFIESPNYDERPVGTVTDLLVIHNISLPPNEFFGDWIVDFFCNRLDINAHPYFATIAHLQVSAHALLRRDGSLIQLVSFNKRAWHAGVSQFAGRTQCNDFSIGIEVEGADDVPYTPIQYQQLARLTRAILQVYPGINEQRIVGHCDIAPERKTDTGSAFDWQHYFHLVNTRL